MQRERIDKLLVDQGLDDSRTRAQAMVMAGSVLVDEQLVDKPSVKFPTNAKIRIKRRSETDAYVSRGGVKLAAALREFAIDVNGFVCLDVGASTGGLVLISKHWLQAAPFGPRLKSRCSQPRQKIQD